MKNFLVKIKNLFSQNASGHKYIGVIGGIAGTIALYQFGKDAFQAAMNKRAEIIERRKRQRMTGKNVAQGLVWSVYYGYYQYILPELSQKVEETEWYRHLENDQKKHVSKTLFELIPRKCTIKEPITDHDENIKQVAEIPMNFDRAGHGRLAKIPIYSIKDGKETYYCMFECLFNLRTIRDMSRIQIAGVTKSSRENITFTVEEKNMQLVRLYYAMNSVLNWKHEETEEHFRGKAKLLLFNDVENRKLSDVLLPAIKEDLGIKKDENVGSRLMVDRLETLEEKKDQYYYEFEVYVSNPNVNTKNANKDRYNDVVNYLESNKVKVLREEDTLGKDAVEKLKYAATNCRWIVFLEDEDAKTETFMPPEVVTSLAKIIENSKVKTVAVVNKREKIYIPDELRWVTCIPFGFHKSHLDAIHSVVTGRDVPKEPTKNVFINIGDASVGLAWGYNANYLNKVLPKMLENIDKVMTKKNVGSGYKCPKRLFILIPKSCKTSGIIDDENIEKFAETEPVEIEGRYYLGTIYKLKNVTKKPVYFVGKYATPVTVLSQMRADGFLTTEQMKKEVELFHETVSNIMQTVYPEKASRYCEFIFYDDVKENLSDILLKRLRHYENE